jgi:hypothetical protein
LSAVERPERTADPASRRNAQRSRGPKLSKEFDPGFGGMVHFFLDDGTLT